ncbi:MAG TPA: ABC transporter ATP-binding protein [Sedimentisphaerales bacterium]|nr:ABC transporter ATP-binding protein [Sedimentisphaerales bacterium]
MNIIEVENLSFAYAREPILRNLTFAVPRGAFLAIAGPNGAGKTTLLNLLCGLIKPNAGSITLDAADLNTYSVKSLARKVALVRQEFVPVFDFTVAQVVAMARTPYSNILSFESEHDRTIVAEALRMTNTARFAARTLRELSGGERQRVFIARALAQDTPILLLDEPTSFLDYKHQVAIYDLLKRMQLEKGKTIVTVTHDINLAAQYCDQALLIGPDNSYLIGTTADVFSSSRIENVFGVKTFTGKVGQRKFFLPLGEFAKDVRLINTSLNGSSEK